MALCRLSTRRDTADWVESGVSIQPEPSSTDATANDDLAIGACLRKPLEPQDLGTPGQTNTPCQCPSCRSRLRTWGAQVSCAITGSGEVPIGAVVVVCAVLTDALSVMVAPLGSGAAPLSHAISSMTSPFASKTNSSLLLPKE